MFAESESDVVAELEMNSNLEKTIVSTYLSQNRPNYKSSSVETIDKQSSFQT